MTGFVQDDGVHGSFFNRFRLFLSLVLPEFRYSTPKVGSSRYKICFAPTCFVMLPFFLSCSQIIFCAPTFQRVFSSKFGSMIKIYGAHQIIGSMTTFIPSCSQHIYYAPRFWGLFGPNSGSIIDSKTGFCPIIWERQSKFGSMKKNLGAPQHISCMCSIFFLVAPRL